MAEQLPDDILAMCRFAVGELLKTHAVPQRLDYFFKSHGPKDAWIKWQTAFMQILASKDAIMASGNHYAVKNRFYLESLRKSDSTEKLVTIIRDACGAYPMPVSSKAPSPPSQPPPAMEPANEVEPIVKEESKDTTALLEKLQELMIKSLEIQMALAENVLYVRDRFETRQTKLVERVKALDERLDAIEAKLDLKPVANGAGISHDDIEQIAEIVSNSVSSMTEVVGSIRTEVQQTMQSAIQKADTDRIAKVQASIAKINNEFTALRELTLESLSEVAR
jgi:hypothetical protein